MTDEMKITTDAFCTEDGMACWHGAPGLTVGSAVSRVHPGGPLGRRGIVQAEPHRAPRRYTGLQILVTSPSVWREMSTTFSPKTPF